jgi:hypothetical protein
MAYSSVNLCRKTRTVQQPQPDDANPNTAESMDKNAHRTSFSSLVSLASSNSAVMTLRGAPLIELATFSVWAELMVKVRGRSRVRVAVAACVAGTFSVWAEFTVATGQRQRTPERNGIGRTHARASSERAWDPMASSSVICCPERAHRTLASVVMLLLSAGLG